MKTGGGMKEIKARVKESLALTRVYTTWRWKRLALGACNSRVGYCEEVKRLLIVPSDPWTLTGAKGDEAMMQAVVSQLRERHPNVAVAVATATSQASLAARQMGFEPLEVWDEGLWATVEAVNRYAPSCMAILGADCMDGYYNPLTTLRLLVTADMAARSGVRVAFLGFSFNESPNPDLKAAFNELSPEVSINIRDRVSYERFTAFTRTSAALVADSAFMLPPAETAGKIQCYKSWVADQMQEGKPVIGFNVHPMLLRTRTPEAIARIIDASAVELDRVLRETDISLCLISHDYRGEDGDDVCLAPLYERLSIAHGSRVFYATEQLSAAELKRLTSFLSGVVTGRMHLAIASLGVGTPVAALTYQDKFQGLFKHFDLDESLLLAPQELVERGRLSELIKHFIAVLPILRKKVEARLPAVKDLSARNVRTII